MINLLPPIEKEEQLLNQYKKLTIVLGSVVTISLVCLVLILFALKFYILGEMNYQRIIFESTKSKYQTKDFLFFSDLIQKYNKTIGKVNDFYNKRVYFSDALETLLKTQRPPGLFFHRIAITTGAQDNKVKVMLSGVSENRDNLLLFRNSIKNTPAIENTYLSPESLVRPTNVNFYLTFDLGI